MWIPIWTSTWRMRRSLPDDSLAGFSLVQNLLCLCLSLSVSFCLYVSLSVSVFLLVSVSICLCLSLFVCLPACLSVCLSACLCPLVCVTASVCMFACVFLCLIVSVCWVSLCLPYEQRHMHFEMCTQAWKHSSTTIRAEAEANKHANTNTSTQACARDHISEIHKATHIHRVSWESQSTRHACMFPEEASESCSPLPFPQTRYVCIWCSPRLTKFELFPYSIPSYMGTFMPE